MDEITSTGRRIAHARKRRGLTQIGLAAAAHVSKSLISQVEQGAKPATPSLVAAVAGVLGVEVSELYGQPYRGQTERTDRVHAAIPAIRHVLAYVDVPPELDVPPRPLDDLEREIARLKRLQGAAEHIQLGAALPAAIAELAVHAYTGNQAGRSWRLLDRVYSIAQSLSRILGYEDLSQVAIERCAYAAIRSDDANLPHLVTHSRALLMLSSGALDGAAALLGNAIRDVPATEASASIRSALHLRAAITAARRGSRAEAWEHHGMAAELVSGLAEGTPDYYEMQANSGNVAIHQVAVAVELGNYDQAVRQGGDLQPSPRLTPERRAHHEIDMSRAWLWTGRPERALGAVLKAERIAPQMALYHPMARETATRLLDQRRRLPEQLRGLAGRMHLVSLQAASGVSRNVRLARLRNS